MSDTIILEGPDGRLYEIPAAKLASFAVPGERVAELRNRKSATASAGGHFRPEDAPPGIPPPPSPPTATSTSTTITAPGGGTIVLNFFFGPPAATATASPAAGQVEGYHMSFDANGIPTNHTELLWGDYIDKQGNPAVGWHSHDPVSGNAQ